MNPQVSLKEFWPFFNSSELRRFDYFSVTNSSPDSAAPPFTAVFSYDKNTDSMLLSEFTQEGMLANRWYYQYRVGFGIAEWRDDYRSKSVVLRHPIGWGDVVNIGESYSNTPKMCPARSWPPAFLKGRQHVSYEVLHSTFTTQDGLTYKDVLQFAYLQTWGKRRRIAGARYWMAKGIGPIAVQWIAEVPQGSRMFLECLPLEAKVSCFFN